MLKRLTLLIALGIAFSLSARAFAATNVVVLNNNTSKWAFFTLQSTRPVVYRDCVKPKSAFTVRWDYSLKDVAVRVLPGQCAGSALYEKTFPSSGASEEHFYLHESDGKYSFDTTP